MNAIIGKVSISNSVAFIAQKVLIQAKRGREDRAKDILYIHDTLEVFGARLPELRELWQRSVAPQLDKRDAAKVTRAADMLFADLSYFSGTATVSELNSRSMPLWVHGSLWVSHTSYRRPFNSKNMGG